MYVCLERFYDLDKRCRELDVANNELKQLNAQLEKDLLSVGGVTALFRRGPEVCFADQILLSLDSSRDKQVIAVRMKQELSKMC